MTIIISFAVAAAVTYALRSSMMIAGDRVISSTAVESAVGLVSPAVMTAIIASTLVLDHGQVALPDSASVVSVGAAIVAVRRTGNVSTALVVGLPIYWCVAVVDTVLSGTV